MRVEGAGSCNGYKKGQVRENEGVVCGESSKPCALDH